MSMAHATSSYSYTYSCKPISSAQTDFGAKRCRSHGRRGRPISPRRMEFDELSNRVIGCAIMVHRELDPGLLESTSCEQCLAHGLKRNGIAFRLQPPQLKPGIKRFATCKSVRAGPDICQTAVCGKILSWTRYVRRECRSIT